MSEASNFEREQRLMAYLDGELGVEERSQVEALIESNADYARLIEQWREHGDLIRSMPKHRLDEEFADRVLAEIDTVKSEQPTNVTPNPGEASPFSTLGLDTGTNWRIGAGAIATLAAMLLLTLFVFPNNVDQPTVAVNSNPEKVVENSNDGQPQSKTESSINEINSTVPTTGQPDRVAVGEPGAGPSKPILNKNLAGSKAAVASRDLVPPLSVPENERSGSVGQVLWVDLNSHSTAIADIEAVLLKNSISILRTDADQDDKGADTIQGNQYRLVQRSNSPFEALHVIATRGQVKKAILELSNQHQAKFQAISLPDSQGFFQPVFNPNQTSELAGDTGPNGKVPHLSRMTGSPKFVKGTPGSATVQQLRPVNLSSDKLSPSDAAGDPEQVPDAAEMRQLHEWFELAEKEDELSVVRILLLVDTSPDESK